MKYVLISLVLLWPAAGWAGEPQPPPLQWRMIDKDYAPIMIIHNWEDCTQWPWLEKCLLTIDYEKVDVLNQPDCLATMEKAMKAVQHYIDYFNQGPPELRILEIIKQKIGEHNQAMAKWTAAQRCWRQP